MNFEQTREFLMAATFTKEQWKQLSAVCEIRTGSYSAKQTALSQSVVDPGETHVRLFFERLTASLAEVGIKTPPLGVIRKSQRRLYNELAKTAAKIYQTSCEWNTAGHRQQNFSIGVYHLYATQVISYLRDCKVPLSLKACLQHADKFSGLVDRAFPGYIQNGLIDIVIIGAGND